MTSAAEHATYYRVHPAPPPTVNSLTSRQKAQLRRSNTKLTKVLGAAPQVVDEASPKISHPYALSAPKKLQPSLTVSSGKPSHERVRSAGSRVDPELYPLSSSPRPVSREGHIRHSSESRHRREVRRVRSRSLSEEFERGKESSSPLLPRPKNEAGPRPDSTISRDSLCDSLYEPKFSIPSATKVRREKMARVCKLLGDDVPVDLVFPANDDPAEEDCFILDICAPQEIETPPSSPLQPTPPKPQQRKPAVPPKPEQPRWLAYRTPTLETIVEQSPRSSAYSSTSSADSSCSLLTTTTSSSYRFTSSGCASESSTASFLAHESPSATNAQPPLPPPPPPKFMDEQIHEMSGTHGRREFAIYVPFRRRTNRLTCQAELGKESNGQFEVVRGMLDLRI